MTIDCTIDFGVQPPFEPTYNLSQDELVVLHEYIDKNFKKGFIQHSKSLAGASIFFVKKKDDFLQICVNYCGLNQLLTKN